MADMTKDSVMSNGKDHSPDTNSLHQVQTQGSVVLTAEMFERLYLGPQNKVKGELRQTIGNPTPFALAGFLIGFAPLVFAFFGWRHSSASNNSTVVGTFWFTGGMLPVLGAIFELILGNSFTACVFAVYGSWFLSHAATLTPEFGAYLAYSPDPNNPALGTLQPGFLTGQAFVALMMSIFSLFNVICALRTNICLVIQFLSLCLIFMFVAASFWLSIDGKTVVAYRFQIAAGWFGMIALINGLYTLLSLLFLVVDFPINLPQGDLSRYIPSGSELRKRRQQMDVEKAD